MRNLLCVVGTHAGEVIGLDDHVEHVAFHERVDLTPYDFSAMINRVGMPEVMPIGEKSHYRVEKLKQGDKTYEVLYIRNGQDLIGDLINGYRPTVSKRFIY